MGNGRYQINWRAWDHVIKATGWPRSFTSDMQDRIAMYLLQSYPEVATHPRRCALGYIMEGEIEKAVYIVKQEPKLTEWLGVSISSLDSTTLKKEFEKFIEEGSAK